MAQGVDEAVIGQMVGQSQLASTVSILARADIQQSRWHQRKQREPGERERRSDHQGAAPAAKVVMAANVEPNQDANRYGKVGGAVKNVEERDGPGVQKPPLYCDLVEQAKRLFDVDNGHCVVEGVNRCVADAQVSRAKLVAHH